MTTALTQQFLHELRQKHDVANAVFLVNTLDILKQHSNEPDFDSRRFATGIGMESNVSFEK